MSFFRMPTGYGTFNRLESCWCTPVSILVDVTAKTQVWLQYEN